jgi:hypothetical protein
VNFLRVLVIEILLETGFVFLISGNSPFYGGKTKQNQFEGNLAFWPLGFSEQCAEKKSFFRYNGKNAKKQTLM